MEEFFSFILLIMIIVIGVVQTLKDMGIDDILGTVNREINSKNINKIKENSYIDYTQFFGTESLTDKEFIKKMKIIYSQIMKDKEQDIRQIAELAGCTYPECILKIRYLKQIKKIPEDYFVDEVNGLVNRCSKEDQKLLKKYKLYIYNNHFQINEIAAKLPGARSKNQKELQEEVFRELCYLDDKDLINGIILNRVDRTIIYYSVEKHKNMKDKITKSCPNCGALNELNKGGKVKCEYCGSIIEDELEVEDIKNLN